MNEPCWPCAIDTCQAERPNLGERCPQCGIPAIVPSLRYVQFLAKQAK
jgi:hypothetical protein